MRYQAQAQAQAQASFFKIPTRKRVVRQKKRVKTHHFYKNDALEKQRNLISAAVN